MYLFLMIIHVIISIGLIMVILAQSSKGGALDGFVGGTASNILGGQGASKFLKQTTQILAVLFVVNCILLAFQLRDAKTGTTSKAVEQMKKEAVEKDIQEEELPALPTTDEPLGEPVTE